MSIQFYAGTIDKVKPEDSMDSVYIPYLLGVRNGIEHETEMVTFIKQLFQLFSKSSCSHHPYS